jgi:flagellar FliL protein
MSTASAAELPAPVKGKKKLILIVAAAALVLAATGGAAALMLKKNAHAEFADDEDGAAAAAAAAPDSRPTPVFVPLEPFTVNLADRNADRYVQVGITLEVDSSSTGDQIKTYMPAIRNNILMAIADRTAADLQAREGKAQLADRVRRETSRALGYAVEAETAAAAADASTAPTTKRRTTAATVLPVRAVHFSNFIIQ